jgi:hypothetical protein
MAQNNAALELINLLVTRNFNPEIFDVKTGNPPLNDRGDPDNSRANQFLFHFIGDSGKDYGTVEILFADGVMTVGSGNNTGRAMTRPEDKKSWFDFLLQLKNFAVRHDFNNFQIDNISRMKYLKQSIAQLTESFQGRGQYSWSGQPTEARMLIKHNRRLAETDARFRHIESIFLETADGERYRLPTRSLAHGRAMLEHVRAGGRPWDSRGDHINHMVEQLQILSRFRRAHQGRLFEGDAVTLINETNNYFGSLRRNIKSLATKSGYKKYFESWHPDAVIESELVVEDLRDLFVETRIDPRIEQALPLLAKIQEQNMKQADIFETWANRLVEGTWAIPDTEEKMTQLKLFLSQPQPVGADADAATSALSDILGDDSLFDMLEELAETDPDSDARPVVKAWLDANQNYPEILAIVRELEAEPDVDQEVSMTAQDLPDQQANMREGDNLANPLEEVMSPGAMGMFPEDQGVAEGMEGRVVFSGTGANGSKYEIIQTGPTDFMIHANGRHIDTYSSLQRAMGVLKNEVPGLQQGVAEGLDKNKINDVLNNIRSGKKAFANLSTEDQTVLMTVIDEAKSKLLNLINSDNQIKTDWPHVKKFIDINQSLILMMTWDTWFRIGLIKQNPNQNTASISNDEIIVNPNLYNVLQWRFIITWLQNKIQRNTLLKSDIDLIFKLKTLIGNNPGVAEGSSDTVYPNAEVIKSKNGKPVGEIYQDVNSWGAFHYRADRGYDLIDSREDAIEALRNLHQETGRSRPDYTIKGVAEGQCNMTEAGENCPVHGVAECWVGEVATDPKGWKQPTGAAFESSLARIKSLALLK